MPLPDITADDIDISDIKAKYHVEPPNGLASTIVVDGIPVIDKTKYDPLVSKLIKTFGKHGVNAKKEDFFLPWDEGKDKSKGYAFIDLKNDFDAALAVSAIDGVAFDSKHTFAVNLFSDVEKFAELSEEYEDPEVEDYVPREHLRSWLGDTKGRDQFVTYRADEVVVHWNDRQGAKEIAHQKPPGTKWTDLFCGWSPVGSYFVTVHRQGIRLWGGSSYTLLAKFAHPLVVLFDFSPCEKYLVTWSHEPIDIPEGAAQGPEYFSIDDEGNHVAVWEVATGRMLRSFPGVEDAKGETEGKGRVQWPVLKFSPDDQYVARIIRGQQISCYELPSMNLQGKKSIKIEGVQEYDWCPLDEIDPAAGEKQPENRFVYWTPEVENTPARVTLLGFPSRSIIRQKNLFNASECKFFWQSQGNFLCVQVDRHSKTKKTQFCNLEIFRVREKECPVEVLEIKDAVLDFSWEPLGDRFAIITSSDPNLGNAAPGANIRTDVSFYQLHRKKGEFRLLKQLPTGTSNVVRWAPQGRFVVLATVGSPSKSELQFWDLDFHSEDKGGLRKDGPQDETGAATQHLGTADHFGVTDIEWDPSGRYLATIASAWKHSLENGYVIWNFRGQEVWKLQQEKFKQLLWRPRPKTLLSKDQMRNIRRNLKEHSRVFDQEDAASQDTVSAELLSLRQRLVDEWNAWRTTCAENLSKERGTIKEVKGEEKLEAIEMWVEELIDETIEEIVD